MRQQKQLPLVKKMLAVIVEYHDTTRNDSGLPYPFHPMEVCKDGSDRGIEDDETLAAYSGHDLLEDTKYTEEQMKNDFGGKVTRIVKECSKIGIDDQGIKEKMEFLHSFKNKSLEALLLKLSDRFCNIKDYQRGKRIWYPGYYALQAYPICRHFFDNSTNINNLFGNKVWLNYCSLVGFIEDLVYDQYSISPTTSHKSDEIIAAMDKLLETRNKGKYEQR